MKIAGRAYRPREEIAESNRRFVAAAASGDARTMASVYAEDAELLPPNAEPLRGRDAIERFWQGGIEMGILSLELDSHRLESAGGLAYEVGTYALRIRTNGGASATEIGKCILIHRRLPDNSWRRAIEIFNWNEDPR
jgi:ketosteroid isomerase-like protein